MSGKTQYPNMSHESADERKTRENEALAAEIRAQGSAADVAAASARDRWGEDAQAPIRPEQDGEEWA